MISFDKFLKQDEADKYNMLQECNAIIQQKENIIKELNDKIEDDKMIIEGNLDCIDSLRKDYNLQKNIIKEVREYITSYESISTIEGLEDIEKNKDLNEKTLNEMIRRYLIVHDKILEILDKGSDVK